MGIFRHMTISDMRSHHHWAHPSCGHSPGRLPPQIPLHLMKSVSRLCSEQEVAG